MENGKCSQQKQNSRKIENYLIKRSSKCLKEFFHIECKVKSRCLTILWKSRWVGAPFNLQILSGGGLKQFCKSRWMGGGGSKNRAFCRGGVDFFWNNPIQDSPDFAPYLPVYRLESRVSTLKFPTIKFQIFCVV